MKKYIVSICTVIIMFGCNDFLGIQPKGEVIPETVKHYDLLLNSIDLIESGVSYTNYLTDDAYLLSVDMGLVPRLDAQKRNVRNLYTFSKDVFGDSETDNLWSRSYRRIYNYNTILEKVLTVTDGTEAQKKALWAEALVGRALDYLMLVNAYGKHYDPQTAKTDLAVPLILNSVEPEGTLTRATVEEVYAQVKKDLKEAEEFLPLESRTNTLRASKKAIYGIYARMYLYLAQYDKALEYANKLLETDKFILDIKPFSISKDPYASSYHGRIIGFPDGKDNKEAIFLKLADYEYGFSIGSFVSHELLDMYDLEKDKRSLLYFSDMFYGEPLTEMIYVPYIYINVGISTPEIYLIAAECEARIGNKDRAMELINTLRDNRIVDNTPLGADTNDEALIQVLEERRRELALVGMFRFIDLRRLNRDPRFAKTVTHVVKEMREVEITYIDEETGKEEVYMDYEETGKEDIYTLEPNSPKYVLPIPLKVLRFNPGMPDNDRGK